MTTDPGPHFAITPVTRHVGTAVRITANGKPADKAKPFAVCLHCFSPERGGAPHKDSRPHARPVAEEAVA